MATDGHTKVPFLTFTAFHSSWRLVRSPSVDITEDAPQYWNQPTFRTSNPCLVCVWPERLIYRAVLIKRSPLWLVAFLWCEVWLKVRGCLFAALWDQPTSPCLCLLLLTQSWWVYTMAHMSLTYVYQWVGVCVFMKKKKSSDMENHSYWLSFSDDQILVFSYPWPGPCRSTWS